MYLYRAVDSRGQTIGFLLAAKRYAEAAQRFFRNALAQPHTVNQRPITADQRLPGSGASCRSELAAAGRFDEAGLEALLFPPPPNVRSDQRPIPDRAAVRRDLRRPNTKDD
jgi:hypothetical protein